MPNDTKDELLFRGNIDKATGEKCIYEQELDLSQLLDYNSKNAMNAAFCDERCFFRSRV